MTHRDHPSRDRESGERVSEYPVAVLGGVLVAQGSTRRSVASPMHKFSDCRPGGSRPRETGVPEIVQSEITAANLRTRRAPGGGWRCGERNRSDGYAAP